jgi:hypothetical protein
MLREIDYTAINWNVNNPTEKKIAEELEKAIQKYGKVLVKEKIIAKGTFINIYAYDKTLYRNILVSSIQVG